MEEDKPRGADFYRITARYGGVSGGHHHGPALLFNAANRWVPGLEIGQVTGGWRDLRLKNIRYEQPGVAVNAGEFHLAVKLGCLRDSQLCVNDLSLKDVNVAIDSKKMPKSSLSKKRTAAR